MHFQQHLELYFCGSVGSKITATLAEICVFCRWWNMEDSTALQTRLGSSWRGFNLLEPVILPLTLAESL